MHITLSQYFSVYSISLSDSLSLSLSLFCLSVSLSLCLSVSLSLCLSVSLSLCLSVSLSLCLSVSLSLCLSNIYLIVYPEDHVRELQHGVPLDLCESDDVVEVVEELVGGLRQAQVLLVLHKRGLNKQIIHAEYTNTCQIICLEGRLHIKSLSTALTYEYYLAAVGFCLWINAESLFKP